MQKTQARQFGESLVDRHVISREVLEDAMDESSRLGLPLPTVVLQRGLADTKDLAAALCAAINVPFVDLADTSVQPQAARLVPENLARKFAAIGVEIDRDSVVVAFADPADRGALDEVSTAVHADTGYHVVVAGAERQALLGAIEREYGSDEADSDALVGQGIDPDLHRMFERLNALHGSDLHLAAGQPPLARVLGNLQRLTEFGELSGSRIRELCTRSSRSVRRRRSRRATSSTRTTRCPASPGTA